MPSRAFMTKVKVEKKVDMDKIDHNISKYSFTDYELQNIAINLSIIKHNEFKSLN